MCSRKRVILLTLHRNPAEGIRRTAPKVGWHVARVEHLNNEEMLHAHCTRVPTSSCTGLPSSARELHLARRHSVQPPQRTIFEEGIAQ